MKASIIKGTNLIQNFHSDNYDYGNPNHPDPLLPVKECFCDVSKNKTRHESGAFKYELIDGIVKEIDITQTEEYSNWIDRKRQAKYTEVSDKLLYKYLEKLAASDTDGQKWLAEKAKIKEEIK